MGRKPLAALPPISAYTLLAFLARLEAWVVVTESGAVLAKDSRAREHLATATTMCQEMDMRFWLAQAEAELVGPG